MFFIRMADICVAIDNQYDYVRRLCEEYVITPDSPADITVRVSNEEINHEIEISDFPVTPAYAEGVCVYRAICRQLPLQFHSFLMHCAVIEYEGQGYAFAAKSGTGKSTHIALWQKKFGDSVRIVNGDKPILRFVGDQLRAYGTPWCGKEGWGRNASAPLAGICFLHRDTENNIRRLSYEAAVDLVFSQLLQPATPEGMAETLRLADLLIRGVPIYDLGCTISEEAARMAYEAMK